MPSSLPFARSLSSIGTAALRCMPAETAHEWGIHALQKGLHRLFGVPAAALPALGMGVKVPGIGDLPHPLGLAAGFDKHGLAPMGFRELGLSFLEIGTVTPLPQPGNPRPRMFRYPAQQAIVNRMGFNSDGHHTVLKRLEALRWDHEQCPLGVNLGKNKATPEDQAIEDYCAGLDLFKDVARFFVINISSPNTEGLRNLASEEFLVHLAERQKNMLPRLWVKLDPDMPRRKFQKLIEVITREHFQGVVLTNTHKVSVPEAGGQSGHPLAVLSSACLEWAWEVHQGRLPMIGSGGVLSGADVFQKLARGALAVELYAALVYRGPWAVVALLEELRAELDLRGMATVQDAIGSYYTS